MTVLYRKYRPHTFSDVTGQEHVKAALANEVAAGRIAHSYLFSGPRGVGKTSLARIFAKALNCGSRTPTGEPCGTCGACQEIAEGRALDVIEIDAASHTGVENVREQVIENARFAPSKFPYKVFIIDEAHMLSTSAFNALLKTLEEPPTYVVFILATTELHKVPATVLSRCQRFDFRKIPDQQLIGRLERLAKEEGFSVDWPVLETIARLGEGCLRDAESLLSQVFALGEKSVTSEIASLILPIVSSEAVGRLFEAVATRNAPEALAAWEALLVSGTDPVRLGAELVEHARARALAAMKEEGLALLGGASLLLERLVHAHADMKRLDPPELGFELFLAEWCAPAAHPSMTVPMRAATVSSKEAVTRPAVPAQNETPVIVGAAENVATVSEPVASPEVSAALETVKEKWSDILVAAQKRDHGLPYMLGAAELLACADGTLTVGFQYAMYRDRLNDHRHRETFESALADVLGHGIRVKAILVAQRTDGLVEPSPQIRVEASANLPEGFSDLVKEFGGTIAV